MKDIFLLIGQRKKFYLSALIITLILVVYGALFNVSLATGHCRSSMEGYGLLSGTPTEEADSALAETWLTSDNVYLEKGVDAGNTMQVFYDEVIIVTCGGVFMVIPVVLIFSYVGMSDNKTREFIETLPVKRAAVHLYNYVALLGIMLVNLLAATVTTVIYLSFWNSKILELRELYPELLNNIISYRLISQCNFNFLQEMAVVVPVLIAYMTFLYLCGLLFKNVYAGIGCGFGALVCIYETFSFSGLDLPGVDYENTVMNATPFSVGAFVVITVVLLAIMFLSISGTELSKGKVFRHNILNIPSVILLGGLTAGMVYAMSNKSLGWTVIITSLVVGIALYFLYHKNSHTYAVAVSVPKKIRNSVLQYGGRSYLKAVILFGGGMALVRGAYLYPMQLGLMMYGADTESTSIVQELMHYYFDYSVQASSVCMILFLWILWKGIQYAIENNKATTEYYMTLPVKSGKKFWSKLILDLAYMTIVLLLYFGVNVLFIWQIAGLDSAQLAVNELLLNQAIGFLIWFAASIGVIGIVYFIDAVTVSGIHKNISMAAYFMFMLCFSVMLMNMPNPLLRQLGEFWFAEGTNLFGAIVYFSVGVILLILSAVLCTKRDMSKEKYYYSFANYLFATVSSGMYLIWMFASVNSILMYVLAIASAAIIWYLLVCYGKSKTLDLLKAKKRK